MLLLLNLRILLPLQYISTQYIEHYPISNNISIFYFVLFLSSSTHSHTKTQCDSLLLYHLYVQKKRYFISFSLSLFPSLPLPLLFHHHYCSFFSLWSSDFIITTIVVCAHSSNSVFSWPSFHKLQFTLDFFVFFIFFFFDLVCYCCCCWLLLLLLMMFVG